MRISLVRAEKVAASLGALRDLSIHRTFIGYLCVKRTAVAHGRTRDLAVDRNEFWRTFLRPPGGAPRKPYIVPFIEEDPSTENQWMNVNVAGSYARSSLRPVSPLLKVLKVSGRDRSTRYSLRNKHWERARTHLAFGAKVPALPLAAVLYRDFGLRTEDPTLAHLLSVFKEEFGYASPKGLLEFDHLYRVSEGALREDDWFEQGD